MWVCCDFNILDHIWNHFAFWSCKLDNFQPFCFFCKLNTFLHNSVLRNYPLWKIWHFAFVSEKSKFSPFGKFFPFFDPLQINLFWPNSPPPLCKVSQKIVLLTSKRVFISFRNFKNSVVCSPLLWSNNSPLWHRTRKTKNNYVEQWLITPLQVRYIFVNMNQRK